MWCLQLTSNGFRRKVSIYYPYLTLSQSFIETVAPSGEKYL